MPSLLSQKHSKLKLKKKSKPVPNVPISRNQPFTFFDFIQQKNVKQRSSSSNPKQHYQLQLPHISMSVGKAYNNALQAEAKAQNRQNHGNSHKHGHSYNRNKKSNKVKTQPATSTFQQSSTAAIPLYFLSQFNLMSSTHLLNRDSSGQPINSSAFNANSNKLKKQNSNNLCSYTLNQADRAIARLKNSLSSRSRLAVKDKLISRGESKISQNPEKSPVLLFKQKAFPLLFSVPASYRKHQDNGNGIGSTIDSSESENIGNRIQTQKRLLMQSLKVTTKMCDGRQSYKDKVVKKRIKTIDVLPQTSIIKK